MNSSKNPRERDLTPFERIKRQRAWMLPCLAALFVLNFAAFVNGRLAPAVAVTGSASEPLFVHLEGNANTNGVVWSSGNSAGKSECESNTRHVHVRSIRTSPRVEKSIRIKVR